MVRNLCNGPFTSGYDGRFLAIRNHRLECLKTTDLLTENGGNDDDNVNDETMTIEDVRKLMAGDNVRAKIRARHHSTGR